MLSSATTHARANEPSVVPGKLFSMVPSQIVLSRVPILSARDSEICGARRQCWNLTRRSQEADRGAREGEQAADR